ncbi:MAG TPA: hypothetical protein VMI75_08380, partial [Polyangiaceae bacterium]|nr:hypothetical protein [Polyangiaceae bacterium]
LLGLDESSRERRSSAEGTGATLLPTVVTLATMLDGLPLRGGHLETAGEREEEHGRHEAAQGRCGTTADGSRIVNGEGRDPSVSRVESRPSESGRQDLNLPLGPEARRERQSLAV